MRSLQDFPILKKCYAAYPPLNTKWLDFRNELHMTADKELFIEKKSEGLWPLYEGKTIWQFDPFFEEPRLFLNPENFDDYLKNTEVRRMVSDIYTTLEMEVTPQIMAVLNALNLPYNPENNDDNLKQLHKFVVQDRAFFRLAFRGIASDTNERTLIFSLLPKDCGFGHSMFASIPKTYRLDGNTVVTTCISVQRLLFAMATFNSLVVDYLSRFVIQINVSKTYLERLPLPQPTDDEISSNPEYMKLVHNALKLTLANGYEPFKELAVEFGISKSDVILTDKQKMKVMIENDLIVARLYGVTRDELGHIVESFKVLKSKKPQYIAGLLSGTGEL